MILTEVERATLRLALAALEEDVTATLPMATLNAILGRDWASRVTERRAEFVKANRSMSGGSSLLSASAQNYWADARSVLAYGRLVLSMGSRKAEKVLSSKCEALDESFSARVHPSERGCFLIHDLNGSNWDDRWHACVDFNFPILRVELMGQTVVANPLREAQMEGLAEVLSPPIVDAPFTSSSSVSRKHLIELARRD